MLVNFGILFSSHRAKASEGLYQACEVGFAPTLEYCAEEKVLYIYITVRCCTLHISTYAYRGYSNVLYMHECMFVEYMYRAEVLYKRIE